MQKKTDLVVEYCLREGYPDPLPEYRFHPSRKWRFDYAWPEEMVALEIDGAIWVGGRHSGGAGFIKDCEKKNCAALMGWRVFTAPTDWLKDGKLFALLDSIFMRSREPE